MQNTAELKYQDLVALYDYSHISFYLPPVILAIYKYNIENLIFGDAYITNN